MPPTEPPPPRRSPLAHAHAAIARLDLRPADVAGLALLVAGGLAALLVLWLLARPGTDAGAEVRFPAASAAGAPKGASALGPPAERGDSTAEPAGAPADVTVHVAGRVAAPGVYRLPPGSRVTDAVTAAGGPLEDATLDGVNLARPLVDGEQVLVPGPGVAPAAAGAVGVDGGALRPDGTLDLNLASEAELDELPGIGPVLAERIVAHRAAHGPFGSVDGLRDVRGIGERTFQELAPLLAT